MAYDYQAIYLDGKTAAPHSVRARFSNEELVLRDVDSGRDIARWPAKAIKVLDEVYKDRPVRLAPSRKSDERLTISDASILDELRTYAPRSRWRDYRRKNVGKRMAFWGSGVVAAIAFFLFGIPLLAEPIASVVPLSWEKKLGKAASTQISALLQNPKVCRNSAGQAALNRLVQRLGGAKKSRYTFTVKVLDHKLVNAFAAPGGYIVIFRGLIDKAKTPEEVAGVLAHEIGHVIERHGTEGVIKAAGTSLLFSLLIGNLGGIESSVADYSGKLITLSHTRRAEREADRIGIEILNKTNIRGAGFVAFFQRVQGKESRSTLTDYFSSHPSSRSRIKVAKRLSIGQGSAMSAADWQAIKAICK